MNVSQNMGPYMERTSFLRAAAAMGIQDLMQETTFKKGAIAVEENQIHDSGYFIIEGAVRAYYVKNEQEITSWFAFENQFVGSLENYREAPARETIHFMEDSRCLVINIRKLKERQQKDLSISHFYTSLIEEHSIFLENRLRYLQHQAGLERYLYILDYEPQIIQRVSVNYLASYLGMTRETLSRLRKKAVLWHLSQAAYCQVADLCAAQKTLINNGFVKIYEHTKFTKWTKKNSKQWPTRPSTR